jgi:mannose-6-phosphate isomerase-like protein (cupin superfamily)
MGRTIMVLKINGPSVIEAAGNKPKIIKEYIGRVNSGTKDVSVAHMVSPAGWKEPGQKPEFNEYTVVLKGMLRVKTPRQEVDVRSGEAIIVEAGEWIEYSTPNEGGAEYIAVCLPAFSPESVHRDDHKEI